MIKLTDILFEAFIDSKGNLQDFSPSSEEATKDAAKLQSLGFKVEPIDPDEKVYYLELPNGGVSFASKNKDLVLRLKITNPKTWKDAILKYDNKWLTG
jgi:hypothetical protein